MASLRRNKATPNDATSSRFLYTIMKQLDQKLIDWNLVAKELEITNGHAARMRFSRFRQHMEGSPTIPRKRMSASSEPKAKRTKSTKSDEKQPKAERKLKRDPGLGDLKEDPGITDLESTATFTRVKPEPIVKSELEDLTAVSSLDDLERTSQAELLIPKQEVRVKSESRNDVATETVPFERLIDPAICDYKSPKSLPSPERRIKKEERPQPAFTFSQYTSPEVERQSPYPGLPFLEILSPSEGM